MGHDFCNKLFFITRGKFDTFVIWPIVHQSWSYLPTLLVDSLITLPFSGGLNPINKYDHFVHLYPKKTKPWPFFSSNYIHTYYTHVFSLYPYQNIVAYIYIHCHILMYLHLMSLFILVFCDSTFTVQSFVRIVDIDFSVSSYVVRHYQETHQAESLRISMGWHR